MLWILLAITAHIGNSFVFVVDKSLLNNRGVISQPVRYAFYSGLLAGLALIILPFAYAPLSLFIVRWSLIAGVFHLGALWLFFYALKIGEPSRVVPIIGSIVPLFTLVFAILFLGEQLIASQLIAVVLLILGGALLSVRIFEIRSGGKVLLSVIISGALFAAYFVVVKYLYDGSSSFLATFVYSRVIEALAALILLGPVVRYVLPKAKKRKSKKKKNLIISSVFIGNKVLAAGAFMLQGYAIKLGSVSVVSALQGVQYIFLFIVAIIISKWLPRLFKEEMNKTTIWQKVFGILLISSGLIFLL